MRKAFLIVLLSMFCFFSFGETGTQKWITVQELQTDAKGDGTTQTISVQILAEYSEQLGISKDDANKWRIIYSDGKKDLPCSLYSGYLYEGEIKIFLNGKNRFIAFIESNDSFVIKKYYYFKFFKRYFCKTIKCFNKQEHFTVLD